MDLKLVASTTVWMAYEFSVHLNFQYDKIKIVYLNFEVIHQFKQPVHKHTHVHVNTLIGQFEHADMDA